MRALLTVFKKHASFERRLAVSSTAASERATLPPAMPAEMKARLRTFLLVQLRDEDS